MITELLGLEDIARAAELIKSGELVAFPTETVYGLGASIYNPEAIQSIFRVKGRPSDNPLIAHVSSFEQVEEIACEIPDSFHLLKDRFFPGPLTVIMKRHPSVPGMVSAGLDSIALRMPSHRVAQKLIELVGAPLVAPSANLSGKPSSTQPAHVLLDFDGRIAAVIDGGKTDIGIESTVISLLGPRPVLLRPGFVTKEEIEAVLGCYVEIPNSSHEGPVLSPGMKYRHYAPRTPVKLFFSMADLQVHLFADRSGSGCCAFLPAGANSSFDGIDQYLLSAKEFYSLLRHADEMNYQEILILCDEDVRKDAGLMNRITRSAGSLTQV